MLKYWLLFMITLVMSLNIEISEYIFIPIQFFFFLIVDVSDFCINIHGYFYHRRSLQQYECNMFNHIYRFKWGQSTVLGILYLVSFFMCQNTLYFQEIDGKFLFRAVMCMCRECKHLFVNDNYSLFLLLPSKTK